MINEEILNELKNISSLLTRQLESEKYVERRLNELLTGPFGLRSLFALQKQSLFTTGEGKVFEFTYRDSLFRFSLPQCHRDFIQQKIIIEEGFYEQSLLEMVASRNYAGREILDVGANIGNHSVYFAKVCRAGRVVAFEPQEGARNLLTLNAELNDVNNLIALPYALGSICGTASPSHNSTQNTGAVAFRHDDRGGASLRSIDSLGFTPSLIKIDVEGGEIEVLKGATNTLRMSKPDIWVECFSQNFDELNSLLLSYDYSLELKMPGHNYLYCKKHV